MAPESSADAITRAFCRIAGRDSRPTPASARLAVWGGGWPASRALAGAVRHDPARPGAVRRGPGAGRRRARWRAARAGPGGQTGAAAAILMISSASCRGRPHHRASALARAMLGMYSLDRAQHDRPGSGRAGHSPGGDNCRPATFRCGYASVCWRSCYPVISWLLLGSCLVRKFWVPTCYLIVNFVKGRRRVAIRMVPQTPARAGPRASH